MRRGTTPRQKRMVLLEKRIDTSSQCFHKLLLTTTVTARSGKYYWSPSHSRQGQAYVSLVQLSWLIHYNYNTRLSSIWITFNIEKEICVWLTFWWSTTTTKKNRIFLYLYLHQVSKQIFEQLHCFLHYVIHGCIFYILCSKKITNGTI